MFSDSCLLVILDYYRTMKAVTNKVQCDCHSSVSGVMCYVLLMTNCLKVIKPSQPHLRGQLAVDILAWRLSQYYCYLTVSKLRAIQLLQ